jgi:hypothetical protein
MFTTLTAGSEAGLHHRSVSALIFMDIFCIHRYRYIMYTLPADSSIDNISAHLASHLWLLYPEAEAGTEEDNYADSEGEGD